eukprot:245800_1
MSVLASIDEPLLNDSLLNILISGYMRQHNPHTPLTNDITQSIFAFAKNHTNVIDSSQPLEDDPSALSNLVITNSGCIQSKRECPVEIHCDIFFNDGTIDASECGPQCTGNSVYYNGCGRGGALQRNRARYSGASYGTRGESCDVSPGITYGNPQLTKLYFGCGSMGNFVRGGGIIIISCNTFINTKKGRIKCNGDARSCSGGSILIVTNTFRNNGVIEAVGGNGLTKTKYLYGKSVFKTYLRGGHGRIAVYTPAKEEGAGSIHPNAYVGDWEDGLKIIQNIKTNRNEHIITK